MKLRDYQERQKADIYAAWAGGHRNVVAVAPTGGGKTVLFTNIMAEYPGISIGIAHRSELVSQMSMALARGGVRHRVIAARPTISFITRDHHTELGQSFVDPAAKTIVSSVDTLVGRSGERYKKLLRGVGLWVQDEAHHVLRDNKWGRAATLCPNAYGLGVTATPERADRHGIGRHASGLFDVMIESLGMHDMIERGYLAPYRIFAPPSDARTDVLKIGSTGDYTRASQRASLRDSAIVGDVVEHYQRIANGLRGVTFATDVDTAERIAGQFRDAGVPALAINAKTPAESRARAIRRLRDGDLLQLVNVDLFGEGFDLPAIEVVSMARPTASFGLYSQQFGRALRPSPGKTTGIIIDHVGNVHMHGLPDRPRSWSLDDRMGEKRSKSNDEYAVTTCTSCMAVYERYRTRCPYCGEKPISQQRSEPRFVDGDLTELDPAALAQLRGEISRVDRPPADVANGLIHTGQTYRVAHAAAKRHAERQDAQARLREAVAHWAWHRRGYENGERYRLFYLKFGVDVATAQTLSRSESEALEQKIRNDLGLG